MVGLGFDLTETGGFFFFFWMGERERREDHWQADYLALMKYRYRLAILGAVAVAYPRFFPFVLILMISDTFMGSIDIATSSIRNTTMNMFGSSVSSEYPEEERQLVEAMEKKKVGGLFNEGNTCFMNSVIQSFTSLQYLREYVQDQEKKNDVCVVLKRMMEKLDEKKDMRHCYSIHDLIKSMEEKSQLRWSGYDQEDAQEFFQQMLTALEGDKKKELNKEKDSEEDEDNSIEKQLLTPFDGVCGMRVGCLNCGEMEGIRKGVISSLDLSVSNFNQSAFGGFFQTSKPLQLEELLAEYCKMEIIPGVECYRCSLNGMLIEVQKKADESTSDQIKDIFNARAKELQDALDTKVIDEKDYKKLRPNNIKVKSDKSKQTMLGAPTNPILMIHINRSVFDIHTGYTRKNHTPVKFPLVLDMGPYIVDVNDEESNRDVHVSMQPSGDTRSLYQLRAAIVHIGSHNFGHYECYRRCNQGFWWKISDENVSLAKESQVLGAQGSFMLFYEKIPPSVIASATADPLTTPTTSKELHHDEGQDITDM